MISLKSLVNEERAKRGMDALDVFVIDVISSSNVMGDSEAMSLKMSSSYLREWIQNQTVS
jgi:phosphopantetheine adenylyltransferase